MTHPMHLDLPAAERWRVIRHAYGATEYVPDDAGPLVMIEEHLRMIAAMQHKINKLETENRQLLEQINDFSPAVKLHG